MGTFDLVDDFQLFSYYVSMSERWYFLKSPPKDPAQNMAIDEALLRTAVDRQLPTLRLYAWSCSAISIGYFQKFPEQHINKYKIIRRPTGGGIVYHGADTTYTLVIPPTHQYYSMSPTDVYYTIHEAISASIEIANELYSSSVSSPHGAYDCFQKPVHGDVVSNGRKVAGAAQRRTKWGFLHQGSIAARLSKERIMNGFTKALDLKFEPYQLSPDELRLSEYLMRTKYSLESWNRLRKMNALVS